MLPEGVARGSVLSKLLRGILEAQGEDAPSPRVIAFAEDAATADTLVTPLRAALWEEYRIGLVLPDGEHPTKILEVRRAAHAGHATPCSAGDGLTHWCRMRPRRLSLHFMCRVVTGVGASGPI